MNTQSQEGRARERGAARGHLCAHHQQQRAPQQRPNEEDNPYAQISDMFCSLTTVKYILESNNLADARRADKRVTEDIAIQCDPPEEEEEENETGGLPMNQQEEPE